MSEYIIECEYDFDNGWIPGEHREEVVRCRDCKHYDVNGHGQGWCIWKYRTDWQVEPDGFCAWAERREP